MANILVVDDDKILLKVVSNTLQKAGHLLTTTTDSYVALEKLQNELFEFVICDIDIPGSLSGFKLATAIRTYEQYKNVAIMFLTGRGEKSDVAPALEAGGDDYLVKPVDPPVLLLKVNMLLARKHELYGVHDFPLSIQGMWNLPFEIVGISEQGFTIMSSVKLNADMKLKLNLPIFDVIGIKIPQLRIANSIAPTIEGGSFKTRAHFVGLDNESLVKVRNWVASNKEKIAV